jgi:hypothetical protein
LQDLEGIRAIKDGGQRENFLTLLGNETWFSNSRSINEINKSNLFSITGK